MPTGETTCGGSKKYNDTIYMTWIWLKDTGRITVYIHRKWKDNRYNNSKTDSIIMSRITNKCLACNTIAIAEKTAEKMLCQLFAEIDDAFNRIDNG